MHSDSSMAELLDENQRANTIVVYNYQEELAELKRRREQSLAGGGAVGG